MYVNYLGAATTHLPQATLNQKWDQLFMYGAQVI